MGLIITGYFYWMLEKTRKENEASTSLTTVLRAKKFIKAGRLLTRDLVEEVPIHQGYLEPYALQAKKEIVNDENKPFLKARISIRKREQLTQSKLVDERVFVGLAWTLPSGQRALTLRLNPEQAVGGWIQPGDWVQIFSTLGNQEKIVDSQTKLLLPRTQVLAIEDKVWDPMASLHKENLSAGLVKEPILVTIGITSQEVALIILAAKKGDLTLALLSPTDENIKYFRPIRVQDLR